MIAKAHAPGCGCGICMFPPRPYRTHSPITGEPYPKCKAGNCTRNVYAAGYCYGHQPSHNPSPKE